MSEEIFEEGHDNGFERLVNFSDAVIAIAITLLALDIQLPAHTGELDADGLYRALLATWPKGVAYVISFLMIGQFWFGHHVKFRHLRGFDGRLITINLFFLMSLCFVPFSCSVLAEYHNSTAFILYSLNMMVSSLLSAGLWAYALAHPKLLAPHVSTPARHHSLTQPLILAAVFAAGAVISYFDLNLGHAAWLLLIPAVTGRLRVRKTKLPEAGNPG